MSLQVWEHGEDYASTGLLSGQRNRVRQSVCLCQRDLGLILCTCLLASGGYLSPHFPHSFYATQRKTLEINPRHPLIRELQRRIEGDEHDETTADIARLLYETASLRSGFALKDSSEFANRIENMMRLSLGVDLSASVRFILSSLSLIRREGNGG